MLFGEPDDNTEIVRNDIVSWLNDRCGGDKTQDWIYLVWDSIYWWCNVVYSNILSIDNVFVSTKTRDWYTCQSHCFLYNGELHSLYKSNLNFLHFSRYFNHWFIVYKSIEMKFMGHCIYEYTLVCLLMKILDHLVNSKQEMGCVLNVGYLFGSYSPTRVRFLESYLWKGLLKIDFRVCWVFDQRTIKVASLSTYLTFL